MNAISGETNIHEHPHEGLQGFVSGFGGSNNNEAGGSASFDLGTGNWRIFGNGGAQRAGAYKTSEGRKYRILRRESPTVSSVWDGTQIVDSSASPEAMTMVSMASPEKRPRLISGATTRGLPEASRIWTGRSPRFAPRQLYRLAARRIEDGRSQQP